jgi:possible lipopolysaccharide cholinephosphotransferase
MEKLDFRSIQLEELKLLLAFKQFCEKYKLKYYLCGGTLLGAIRHQGFIPWDDDIDVCMPRPDYEQMIRIVKETQEIDLIAFELDNCTYPYAKLVNKQIIVKREIEGQDDQFLWMDIFPMDGIPSSLKETESLYRKIHILIKSLLLSKTKLGYGSSLVKKIGKFIVIPLLRVYGSRRIACILRRIALSTNYEEAEYAGGVVWGLYGIGERMIKADFEKEAYKEFEGNIFPVFSCWHEYLSGLYNNYMELPPEDKQQCHEMEVFRIKVN